MGAFHAYDIRGVYNVDFDKELAYKVGYFLPELLSADKVLVGRDARVSSPEIHDYLVKGITDAGADVYDVVLSTTPMAKPRFRPPKRKLLARNRQHSTISRQISLRMFFILSFLKIPSIR